MALPGLGFIRTFALGSIVSVAAYIVVVSPSLVRGLRYGALTLVLGVGLYALAPKVVVLFASATLLVLATSVSQLLAGSTVQSYGLAVSRGWPSTRSTASWTKHPPWTV